MLNTRPPPADLPTRLHYLWAISDDADENSADRFSDCNGMFYFQHAAPEDIRIGQTWFMFGPSEGPQDSPYMSSEISCYAWLTEVLRPLNIRFPEVTFDIGTSENSHDLYFAGIRGHHPPAERVDEILTEVLTAIREALHPSVAIYTPPEE